MQYVELGCHLAYFFEKQEVRREGITQISIQPQRLWPGWFQPRISDRISARKKSHIMPLSDELLGQE